jgi:hypothetical protein
MPGVADYTDRLSFYAAHAQESRGQMWVGFQFFFPCISE